MAAMMVTRIYVCMNYEQYDEVRQNIHTGTYILTCENDTPEL